MDSHSVPCRGRPWPPSHIPRGVGAVHVAHGGGRWQSRPARRRVLARASVRWRAVAPAGRPGLSPRQPASRQPRVVLPRRPRVAPRGFAWRSMRGPKRRGYSSKAAGGSGMGSGRRKAACSGFASGSGPASGRRKPTLRIRGSGRRRPADPEEAEWRRRPALPGLPALQRADRAAATPAEDSATEPFLMAVCEAGGYHSTLLSCTPPTPLHLVQCKGGPQRGSAAYTCAMSVFCRAARAGGAIG